MIRLEQAVLGGTRPGWVLALGESRRDLGRDLFGEALEVYWIRDAADQERASRISLLLAAPVDVSQAREQAHRYHPPDGQPIRVYAAPDGREVKVFLSAELALAFTGATVQGPPGLGRRPIFGTDPPGTYVEVAEQPGSMVSEVMLALGGGP